MVFDARLAAHRNGNGRREQPSFRHPACKIDCTGKMEHSAPDKNTDTKSAIIIALILVVLPGMLTGCLAIGKSSGITASREATEIWHSYEILPNYHYYFYGPVSQPFYLIGIDDQYHLTSSQWKPVALTPGMLKNWFNYIHPRVGFSPDLWGAWISGPNGERIGLWYSVRDWRRLGSARLGENNQVSVIAPSATDPRKMRLFFINRDKYSLD